MLKKVIRKRKKREKPIDLKKHMQEEWEEDTKGRNTNKVCKECKHMPKCLEGRRSFVAACARKEVKCGRKEVQDIPNRTPSNKAAKSSGKKTKRMSKKKGKQKRKVHRNRNTASLKSSIRLERSHVQPERCYSD